MGIKRIQGVEDREKFNDGGKKQSIEKYTYMREKRARVARER